MFDQTTRKYTFQAFTSFHLPYLTHARPEQHFHNKILETDILIAGKLSHMSEYLPDGCACLLRVDHKAK